MFEQFFELITVDNILFLSIGLLGMLMHAVKKYYANELSGSIVDYLFFKNPKRSILAVLTTLGTLLAIILENQVPSTQIGSFMLLAFTTGFTADSTVNKDSDHA